MDSLGLALRVGLSLACVLGLVWLLSKGMLKTSPGRGANRDRVKVIARQPLSRVSSVAVVQIGERALVLGVTEQHVTLLTEAELDALVVPSPGPPDAQIPGKLPSQRGSEGQIPGNLPTGGGPLAGSALSPVTWSQAVEALRERTVRR